MEHQTAGLIDTAERAARLKRERRYPRYMRGEPRHVGRLHDGLASIALLPHEGHVVRDLVPHRRRAGGPRRCHRGNGGSVLRLDDDELGCRHRGIESLGHDKCDRFAHATDAVPGKHGAPCLMRHAAVRAR
jgi:hypothetical protein